MLRTQPRNAHRIEWAQQNLYLTPSGAIYWEEGAILFLADLHLGKETSFRRGGIPIPSGSTKKTFERLRNCIEDWNPKQVFVLGDLVHARCSWDGTLADGFEQLFRLLDGRDFFLVEGNHDRGSNRRWADFPIQVLKPPTALGPWTLLHDMAHDFCTTESLELQVDHFCLAGHLHPGTLIGSPTSEKLRLRCFWLANDCLTLPAFGEFTGNKTILPSDQDQVFAIADDAVIEVS